MQNTATGSHQRVRLQLVLQAAPTPSSAPPNHSSMVLHATVTHYDFDSQNFQAQFDVQPAKPPEDAAPFHFERQADGTYLDQKARRWQMIQ